VFAGLGRWRLSRRFTEGRFRLLNGVIDETKFTERLFCGHLAIDPAADSSGDKACVPQLSLPLDSGIGRGMAV
jgi:hypothetical protein